MALSLSLSLFLYRTVNIRMWRVKERERHLHTRLIKSGLVACIYESLHIGTLDEGPSIYRSHAAENFGKIEFS